MSAAGPAPPSPGGVGGGGTRPPPHPKGAGTGFSTKRDGMRSEGRLGQIRRGARERAADGAREGCAHIPPAAAPSPAHSADSFPDPEAPDRTRASRPAGDPWTGPA